MALSLQAEREKSVRRGAKRNDGSFMSGRRTGRRGRGDGVNGAGMETYGEKTRKETVGRV